MQESSKSRKWLWSALALVLIAAGATGVWFLVPGKETALPEVKASPTRKASLPDICSRIRYREHFGNLLGSLWTDPQFTRTEYARTDEVKCDATMDGIEVPASLVLTVTRHDSVEKAKADYNSRTPDREACQFRKQVDEVDCGARDQGAGIFVRDGNFVIWFSIRTSLHKEQARKAALSGALLVMDQVLDELSYVRLPAVE